MEPVEKMIDGLVKAHKKMFSARDRLAHKWLKLNKKLNDVMITRGSKERIT